MASLRRRFGLRLIAVFGASGVQAVNYIVLARLLEPAGFGVFGQLTAAGGFLGTLLGFGFTARALRLGAEPDAGRIRSTMLLVRMSSTVVIALAIGVTFLALHSDAVTAVWLALAFLVTDLVTDLGQGILSGSGRLLAASVVLVSQRLLLTLALLLGTAVPDALVPGVAVAAAGGVGAHLLLAAERHRPAPLGAVIARSRGFHAAGLASSLSQLETPLIGSLGGSALSGLYAAGARVASPLTLVTASMLNVLVPEMAHLSEAESRRQVFLRMRRISLMLAAVAVLVAPLVAWLAVLVLGEAYAAAAVPVVGFVIGGGVMGLNQTHQAYLFAEDRAAASGRCVLIGATVGLLWLVIGVPLGPVGIAICPPLAQLTMLVFFVRATRKT